MFPLLSKNILPDSSAATQANELASKSPLPVSIQNLMPNTVKVTKTEHTMLTPDVPGIVVSGQKGEGFYVKMDCFVFCYDKQSRSYKQGYAMARFGSEVRTEFGKILGDERNAVAISIVNMGAD